VVKFFTYFYHFYLLFSIDFFIEKER